MRRLFIVLAGVAVLAALATGPALASGAVGARSLGLTVTRDAASTGLGSPAAAFDLNFDDVSAPCFFNETTALRGFDGVTFKGKRGGGGAILNSCSQFGVTGFSAPNFLGFNCRAQLMDLTRAKLPETIKLGRHDVQTGTTFLIGSFADSGKSLHVVVSNSVGASAAGDFVLTSALAQITVTGGINKIALSSTDPNTKVCSMVLDDLTFTR